MGSIHRASTAQQGALLLNKWQLLSAGSNQIWILTVMSKNRSLLLVVKLCDWVQSFTRKITFLPDTILKWLLLWNINSYFLSIRCDGKLFIDFPFAGNNYFYFGVKYKILNENEWNFHCGNNNMMWWVTYLLLEILLFFSFLLSFSGWLLSWL